jgi:quinol monooxygenase YgiN
MAEQTLRSAIAGRDRLVANLASFTSMVRLSVVLYAPTGQARMMTDALRSLIRGTRLEPGCLDCQVWTAFEEGDETRVDVHYQERWVTEKAMEVRVQSDAFTRVLEVLEASDEPPQVEFDFVSRHQGLEYVEAVRGRRR